MPVGPVEYLLVEFPGSKFNGDIIPALTDLVDNKLISIIDLVFLTRADDGTLLIFDLDEIADETLRSAFDGVEGDYGSLLGEDDLVAAAEALEPGSSAGLLIFENLWASPLVAAIRGAGGQVVANERIPGHLIDTALAHTAGGER